MFIMIIHKRMINCKTKMDIHGKFSLIATMGIVLYI
jgi:hypothetical protein